jgi:segregation and condensation protein B
MADREKARSIIEAIIFVSDEPVTLRTMKGIFPDLKEKEVREITDDLSGEYLADAKRGIYIEEVAGGYQFRTKPELAPWLRRLKKVKPVRLSQASLETLAIVAYKQPVTKPEVDSIRGVESGGVIQTLLDRKMVKIMGRKDAPGKPIVYGTTREFLEVFSLKDLAGLPSLREIKEISESREETPPPIIQMAGQEEAMEAQESATEKDGAEDPEGREE